jgi:hypothetical protein
MPLNAFTNFSNSWSLLYEFFSFFAERLLLFYNQLNEVKQSSSILHSLIIDRTIQSNMEIW